MKTSRRSDASRWFADFDGVSVTAQVPVVARGKETVAIAVMRSLDQDRLDANVRLIEASPCLFAAAVAARKALSDLLTSRDPIVYADALRLLDEAIAKVVDERAT